MTSDPHAGIRPVHSCRSYGPGHTVHHIQAKKVSQFLDHYPERCTTVHLTEDDDGWFTMGRDGETARGWNHDADQVRMFVLDSLLGTVQFVPFSCALVSARYDRDGTRTGQAVLYPAWQGLDTPQGVWSDEVRECRYPDAAR